MQGCDAVVHFRAESPRYRSIYEPGRFDRDQREGHVHSAPGARQKNNRALLHISNRPKSYGEQIEPGKFAAENSTIHEAPTQGPKALVRLLVSFLR